jgi:hypothetical protein
MKLTTMFLSKNKMCSNCANFLSEWDNAGLCTQLGVLPKRGEYILDGIDVFEKLNVDKLEYRRPVVNKRFGCIYWKRMK